LFPTFVNAGKIGLGVETQIWGHNITTIAPIRSLFGLVSWGKCI